MKRPFVTIVGIAALSATPLFAADTLPWPWKSKIPLDPALVVLAQIDELTATVDKSIVTISVKAMALTPGYSELQFTPRMGDPKDRIFAFDARGRAPQKADSEVTTPVTIEASYSDAPIGRFDVIEVYGKGNCKGYSVKDGKRVECTSKAQAE